MIARYGPDAVAGFGVASRVESMVLVIYYALSSVIGPFVGQTFSRKKGSHSTFLTTVLRFFVSLADWCWRYFWP